MGAVHRRSSIRRGGIATGGRWLALGAGALLLALAACTGRDELSQDCADLACEAEAAARLFVEEPARARALVLTRTDPMVRAHLVEAMIEARPEGAAELCPIAPEGPVRERCQRIAADEPGWHLDPARPSQAALTLGERAVVLAPGPTFRLSPLPRGEPLACAPEVPRHTCRELRAIEAARLGQAEVAAGACDGITGARWREACMAAAAEQACGGKDLDGCGRAAELCLEAGTRRPLCLDRIARALAATAPAAEGGDPEAWATLHSRVRELRARLSPADPILADRVVQRVWAEALLVAYGLARLPNGAPLSLLPPEVEPHARAAVAWRLSTRTEQESLAERADLVLELLSKRERRRGGAPMSAARVEVPSLWPTDLPGEEGLGFLPYLQGARRTFASEPRTDARICVLEAAARLRPPDARLLEEGLRDEDRRVRWTAARLLAEVLPDGPALARARQDADSLVRQRAASVSR